MDLTELNSFYFFYSISDMITFILSVDFQRSAELLDKRRCWKQILESKQLLERIELLHYLAEMASITIPSKNDSIDVKYRFVRQVMKWLKDFAENSSIEGKKQLCWEEEDQIVVLPYEKGRPNRLKTGHIYHTIILFWLGYEDALAHYIACHHYVWKTRGKCCCDLEKPIWLDSTRVDFPPWIEEMVGYHRRIMIRKDREYYSLWKGLEPLDKVPWDELSRCFL